jgi:hypothetical protein
VLLKCTAMLGNYFIKSEEVSLQYARAHLARDTDADHRAVESKRPYTGGGGLFEDSSQSEGGLARTQSGAVRYEEDGVRYYSDILISSRGSSLGGLAWPLLFLFLRVLGLVGLPFVA